MKNIFKAAIVISLVIVVNCSLAQVHFSFKKDSSGLSGSATGLIGPANRIYNDTNIDLNVRWVKILKSWPTGWDVSFCDVYQCHPSDVDSADFILSAGDTTHSMEALFLPSNIDGTGKLKVLLYEISGNRNEGVIITFTATTSLGIKPGSKTNNFVLYPVPARETINVLNNLACNQYYEIFSLEGKSRKTGNINHTKTSISISDLPTGSYFIRISDKTGNSTIMDFYKN